MMSGGVWAELKAILGFSNRHLLSELSQESTWNVPILRYLTWRFFWILKINFEAIQAFLFVQKPKESGKSVVANSCVGDY